ncbi:MAG: SDR family NAD(P)-dependent oxidoreductase [Alphaproteobacteria bacterium]|nr:SDR family NAD(P)-dependent oxidoreductase [Alphaproteobacteria bacterium]
MIYRGKWALVTGASAGIGEAFARALAARGANVALVARRKDRLEALAAGLKRDYAVDTRVIAADLSQPNAPDAAISALGSEGLAPDILVNNAGFGLPGTFAQNPWAAHREFLELMVVSYAHFVRLVLPGMTERGFGRIIQVSSVAGLIPGSAGHTLYGASKAFLVSFSQSLAAECEGTGVNVSAVCPGFTYSEFHDVNATRELVSQLPKYMFMRAEPVVEGALNAVENGHVVYVPGLWNKFVVWLAKALPRPWAAEMVKGQSRRFRKQEG